MRRIVVAGAGTVGGVVLLLSYPTSTNRAVAQGSAVGAPATQVPASGGSTSGGSASGATTVTGDRVQTRWGPVTVRITVEGGRITAAEAVDVPSGNRRDEEINAYAVPVLQRETVAAQGAGIDAVSGATVTSEGYISSLQSAIDRAHL